MRTKACNLLIFAIILISFFNGPDFSSAQEPKPEKVPTPDSVLSFKIGTPGKLADMNEIFGYFHKIAPLSDKITVNDLGTTTEGNPFLMAVISSPENIRNLDKLKSIQDKLADIRKMKNNEFPELLNKGKTIVLINCSLHSTEVGAAQMSMKLAYDLITGNSPLINSILNNVILLLVPIHNPDGYQMVADWYKKYTGTKYEGGSMPWLYHKYVGHDNNRDWFMFTQKETQITVEKIHNIWHPQIVVDMHQMGSTGARLFVPPYIDPYEPNVDPILAGEAALLGTYISSILTTEGKEGVLFGESFDAFTPARAYQHYHGGVRILTEAASCKIATTLDIKPERLRKTVKERKWNFPLPWKGGKWSLHDIIEYDKSAVMAVLRHAARNREMWLTNFYTISKKAMEYNGSPFAFLFHPDQNDVSELYKLISVLQKGCVEIHKAAGSFTVDGHAYPSGTIIIYSKQPYGSFARAMLEKGLYPKIEQYPGGPLRRPYDATAHSLPLLFNLRSIATDTAFKTKTVLMEKTPEYKGKNNSKTDKYGYLLRNNTLNTVKLVNKIVSRGENIYFLKDKFKSGNNEYNAGAVYVPKAAARTLKLPVLAEETGVDIYSPDKKTTGTAFKLGKLKFGLYKPWTSSIDEGWTRFILDDFSFQYVNIFDKEIRKGKLDSKYNVILIPDIRESSIINGRSEKAIPPEYANGIGETGVKNLKEFVEKGGTLIMLNNSCTLALKHFWVNAKNKLSGLKRTEFYIPGSILQLILDTGHPVAYGYNRETPVFFSHSPSFTVTEGKSIGRFPVTNPLLSGWITGDKHLHNSTALAELPLGKGKIILFGFRPQFRAQSRGTFKLLFNAIYYGNSSETILE